MCHLRCSCSSTHNPALIKSLSSTTKMRSDIFIGSMHQPNQWNSSGVPVQQLRRSNCRSQKWTRQSFLLFAEDRRFSFARYLYLTTAEPSHTFDLSDKSPSESRSASSDDVQTRIT